MKTIRFLKLSVLLQVIFYGICAASLLCLYFGHFTLGLLLSCFWMLNPVGPICCAEGIGKWLSERGEEDSKRIIGKKWILFILLFLLTSAVYFVSAVLWVEITGGV